VSSSPPEPGHLGAVFDALADPTRRHLIEALSDGPGTATGLASSLPISRQAVAKHLDLLDQAGLVERRRRGREAVFELRTTPLGEAASWIDGVGAEWDKRLRRLSSTLDS
jgi:DNA-binding transcriptional ArsR family regulator